MENALFYSLFVIFAGAGVLSTVALYAGQSLLVAYMVLGGLLGPWGLGLVSEPHIIKDIGDFGIIFLLFLLGLNLNPQNLFRLLRETMAVTLVSSAAFGLVGYFVATLFQFTAMEALVIGTTMMFSSTIIGLKLLPTTILHHQRTGEIIISVLLLQDIIAIFALLLLQSRASGDQLIWHEVLAILVALPALFLTAFLFERYVLSRVIRRFNRIHEYIFLMAIAWCFAVGYIAHRCGLSIEIGAFIAGVTLAASPISRFIAEHLKPIRDFFLILFFFALGAGIDMPVLMKVLLPAGILAVAMMVLKPVVFSTLLRHTQSSKQLAWELGVRLGQISEFSLLVGYYAISLALIGDEAFHLIQATTILTFIASSYIIVRYYPTPIATNDKLRRD